MKKIMNIALCMIEKDIAKTLGSQFLNMDFYVTVHRCYSLAELSDCITKNEINCFVFDTNSTKYNIGGIVEKLRSSHRFTNASMVFIHDTEKIEIPYKSFNVKTDLMIDRSLTQQDYIVSLAQVWNAETERMIPPNFSVLILDNNPQVLEVLGMHMESLQHKNFITCQSVKEAKSILDRKDFDLLLLDWDLEDGTCLEIIEHARCQASFKKLKEPLTIVITGRNAVEDIMTLIDMNVKDHIIKPFDYLEFEDKIHYALERHQKKVG